MAFFFLQPYRVDRWPTHRPQADPRFGGGILPHPSYLHEGQKKKARKCSTSPGPSSAQSIVTSSLRFTPSTSPRSPFHLLQFLHGSPFHLLQFRHRPPVQHFQPVHRPRKRQRPQDERRQQRARPRAADGRRQGRAAAVPGARAAALADPEPCVCVPAAMPCVVLTVPGRNAQSDGPLLEAVHSPGEQAGHARGRRADVSG